MKRETLYEMRSPYRDNFRIDGFWFGEGAKTAAIVGAMREPCRPGTPYW